MTQATQSVNGQILTTDGWCVGRLEFTTHIDAIKEPPHDPWLGESRVVVLAAYAQSWFTVQHLMRNYRDGFFEYIRYVRDPANQRELGMAPRFDLLSRFAGRTPEELEHELQRAYSQQ